MINTLELRKQATDDRINKAIISANARVPSCDPQEEPSRKTLIFIALQSPLSTSITIEVKFLNGPLPRLPSRSESKLAALTIEILSPPPRRSIVYSIHSARIRSAFAWQLPSENIQSNPLYTGYREPIKPGSLECRR